jgi:hypothetical protein
MIATDMSPPDIRIYQIFYDEASREALDLEAIPLDNTAGPPDWYEFWPILNFLRHNELDDDTFYGFLSPAFSAKTGFSLAEVKSIVEREQSRDVIMFSSHWLAVFMTRNPWVYGEHSHPGMLQLAQTFFNAIGAETDLARLTTDSTTAAFSNYIVAKPAYWRKWRVLAEQYYAFVKAQGPDGPHQEVTTYRGERSVSYKVFIQERLCSHILLSHDFDTVMPDHPFPPDRPIANPERLRAVLAQMDGQKRRYRDTGNPIHLLHIRLLGIAYSRAARGGTFTEWALDGLRRKIGRPSYRSNPDGASH